MGEEHERGDSIDRGSGRAGVRQMGGAHGARAHGGCAAAVAASGDQESWCACKHAQGVLRGKRCQRRQGFAACFRLGVHHELQQEVKGPDVRAKPRSSAAMVRCGAPSSQYCRIYGAGLRAVEMAQRDDGFPLQPA